MCNTINENNELSRILFLIVEGHSLSTELQAAVYSIALEAITNIISEENETKFLPIPDKKVAKKIIEEFKELLIKHSKEISEDGLETINRKLSVINSQTNKQKLLKPFELLSITLNEKEIEAINKRNDFLHGRLPLSLGNEDDKFILQQISFTILYCVTSLILKYVGYSGYVMYYPTLNEFTKKKNISDYLIKNI